MACEPAEHDFAPVALLRAAAFPIDRLDGLGDSALASLALTAGNGPVSGDLVAAYERAMERERRLLREVTVGDEAFMKALVIANPQLARSAAAVPGRRRRKAAARDRRLYGALYRHLSRAVGRTEPADLWAGVALAEWAGETTVRRQSSTVLVQPDLRPFQFVLRSLAARPPYLWSEPWRANATLTRQDDGRWRYSTRLRDGRVVDRAVEPNPVVDVVVPLLPSRGETLGDLVDRLAGRLGVDTAVVRPQLEAYVEAGVLVGGLDLPTRFATAWEALDRCGERLTGGDQQAWREAVGALRGCAAEIEGGLTLMTPRSVAAVVDTAEGVVRDLARRLGVTIAPPRAVLRCDLGLGLRVTLGPDVRKRLGAALADHEAPGGPAGAGAVLRSQLAAGVRSQVGEARPLAETALRFRSVRTGGGLPPPPGAAGSGSAGSGSAGSDLSRAPVGCLMVGLEESGDGPSPRVRGVFDEVAPLYGRFAPLWGGDRGRPDPLYRWLRRQLDGLSAACHLRLIELAGPCEVNPNALAAPAFVDDVVELWGTTEGAEGLAGAQVGTDPVTGSPVVRLPGRSEDVVVFSFSSADLARDDRVTELLLSTSGRIAPAASFEAGAAVSSRHEGVPAPSSSGHAPATGAGPRPRRTLLSESAVEELRAATGVQQFVRWQRLAATHRWPATVRVRLAPGEPALLVRTMSPLAVEAVLGRLSDAADRVVVEDADRLPWLADDTGARYVSELAVPFSRSTHLWSGRATVGSATGVGGGR
ncbi:hypothetical protein GCM10023168_13810 [Fodinibacter luteus]|uniref:Lantibiotic dehydratase N-terminal domain-containing protein n=1 Tax=Fodinibacter luteus TaxID=552064 RepID=A0ABP8KAM6_9MICO